MGPSVSGAFHSLGDGHTLSSCRSHGNMSCLFFRAFNCPSVLSLSENITLLFKTTFIVFRKTQKQTNTSTAQSLTDAFQKKNPSFLLIFAKHQQKFLCCWKFGDLNYIVTFVQGDAKAFRDRDNIFPFQRMSKNNFLQRKAMCLLKLLSHSLRESISVISYLSVLPLCGLLAWGCFNV